MNMRLTLLGGDETVMSLVRDFARGLGCTVANGAGAGGVVIELPDGGDTLLELLDYIALSATKERVDLSELLCRLTYTRPGAAAEVTLGLRLAEFSLARSTSADR